MSQLGRQGDSGARVGAGENTATDRYLVFAQVDPDPAGRQRQVVGVIDDMPKSKWQRIEAIPEEMKDGRLVHVKRVHERSIVKEGPSRFDVPASGAPMTKPTGPHPLDGWPNREQDIASAVEASVTKRWMVPDRMYAFPEPTHWHPEISAQLAQGHHI